MELELGLALPISAHFPTKTTYHLDQQPQLKNNASLGLALEFKNLMMIKQMQKQKRSFCQAFDDDKVDDDDDDDDNESKTLSLLVWNGRRPNNHDEDGEGRRRKPFDTDSK